MVASGVAPSPVALRGPLLVPTVSYTSDAHRIGPFLTRTIGKTGYFLRELSREALNHSVDRGTLPVSWFQTQFVRNQLCNLDSTVKSASSSSYMHRNMPPLF